MGFDASSLVRDYKHMCLPRAESRLGKVECSVTKDLVLIVRAFKIFNLVLSIASYCIETSFVASLYNIQDLVLGLCHASLFTALTFTLGIRCCNLKFKV